MGSIVLDWTQIIIGVIITVVGGLVLNYISSLLTKAKAVSEPIKKLLLERECETCKGRGLVPCVECKGSGALQRETVEEGLCPSCKGSGLISVTCLTCSGSGAITKQLRYEVVSSPSNTYWTLIPWGWHQNVKILLRNMDEKAGRFTIRVELKDSMQQSKQTTLFIRPGDIGESNFTFDVDKQQGYESEYDVQPETLPFTCMTCQGTRSIRKPCEACQGSGKISARKQVVEPCPKCVGQREIKCSQCNGIGKVSRFGK